MKQTLKALHNAVAGSSLHQVTNPDSIELEGVQSLQAASAKDVSFVTGKPGLADAKASKAAVILIPAELVAGFEKPALIVPNVELALIAALNLIYPPRKPQGKRGNCVVAGSARIGEGTEIGNFVSIGENAVIGKNCIIGDNVSIGDNVQIGDDARIGPGCVFHADVKVGARFVVFGNSTFGADGFRFTLAGGIHHKTPHIGGLAIGDDVEMGANCTVDRGTFEDTTIGSGTKFDNQVHVGHNCHIGKNVIIAGQSGVAGSTTIGDNTMIGGACAISDHVTLAPGTMVAGGTCIRNTPDGAGVFAGWDGLLFADFQRLRINLKNLVNFQKWTKRVESLEKHAGIEVKK
ncbi:MAG: UDP-3-O-(3-hydroxymyristoyl)glucosamine N-acyltransferase [Leptospirales bacterium]|nr:UDP-3-O-(3-hydroxymyristoyl)glucosamine N-acyltransferase [Leptospirales bacterium]